MLITGGAGFIGANLIRKVLDSGGSVSAVVRENSDIWRLGDIAGDIEFLRADVRDRDGLRALTAEKKYDFIVSLATLHGHPSPDQEVESLQTSLLGTANLLDLAKKKRVDKFIQIGSSLEYGPSHRPLDERMPMRPSTLRGVARAASTLLCNQEAMTKSIDITVLRLFSVYGYYEMPNRFIPKAIESVLSGNPFHLTMTGNYHDFIFVEDVVEAIMSIIENDPILSGRIINIGSGVQYSNESIMTKIQEIIGRSIDVRIGEYPNSPSDTGNWVANIDLAKKVLGWQPQHSIDEGLGKMIEWMKTYGEPYLDEIK